MPQILCEELMCLQIASQRLLHHRNNGSRTSTGHQREMDSEFSPAFFTIQQSDGKGNHVKTAATGDSATLNDAAPSRPAAEIHVAWNRVCKEVILASRFETVAERNDNLPLSVLDALPMSTKLVATKIARRLGIFTNAATAARFGGNVAAPTRRPKHATYANLIEEFRTAWQHHQEAQSRARLKALKENDADAYMECLQHTKLTSLLHIMELTHSFMISIGAQLDKQQTAQQRPQISSANGQQGHQAKNITTTTAGDDYNRFKEYVASTKDEYKLVHKSAVYVEQQPVGLNATLMPHQLVGLRFLASLHANNINGILADEMGVGKTIQTIAFLLCLKEGGSGAPPFYGPHLVIAPLSIVREWSEACEHFVKGTMKCGELGEIIASGEHRLDTFDLVFLAAHRVRNVTAAINSVRWGYIVVDEAHKAVSNLKTMTAQAINAIPCKHRLVLTGTPLNSDLQELWSLLNFINPNIFKDLNSFDDVFRKPFQAIGGGEGHEGAQLNDEERALLVMRLHQVIRPFMLRRTKRDIDQTLQISYHEIHCPLTFPQELLLRTLREEKQLPCVIEGRCVHRSVLTIEQSAQSLCNHAFMIPFLSQVLERNRLHALALLPPPPPQTSPPTVADVGSKQKCDEEVSVANAAEAAEHLLMQEATDTSRPSTGAAYDHQNSESAVAELDRTENASDAEASDKAISSSEKVVTTALMPAASVVFPSHEALISIGCSGKLLVLDLILRRARAAGVKAVIFTHWLDCIDLLTEYFDGALGWQAGREYVALTGSSSSDERKECVEQFRHDPNCAVFLVSMKAGGCGLNLQVTHLIIMMDRDYTGTNEEQAIARVFRIGQRNIVRALYLLTKDPSEQRILDIAAKKDKPRHAIIEGGGYHVEAVTDEERREVLDKATGAGPADVIDLSSETLLNMCGPHILDSLIVPRCAISSEEDAQAPMTAAVEALLSLNKDGIRSGFFSEQSLPVVFQEALAECQAEKDNKDQLDDLGRGKRNRSHFNEDDIVPDWFWDKLAEEGIDDDEIEDRWKAKRHKERQLAQLSSVSFEASGVKLTEQSVSEEAGSRFRRMPCGGVLTNHR